MRQRLSKKQGKSKSIADASALKMHRRSQILKQRCHRFATSLRQPHMQYRMALLLATLLVVIIGCKPFLLVISHIVIMGYAGHW